MSLSVFLKVTKPVEVYEANITHNLNVMASEAGVYTALWRPEELHAGNIYARELIPILEAGIKRLISNPEHYKKFNPYNGWGDYDNLLRFVTEYLEACKENPDAEVTVSR